MGLPRALFLIPISLGILLSSFAVPAQRRGAGAAKQSTKQSTKPSIAVTKINTDALKALLKREPPRPLLVNFWATWCDPCREEFPDLVKINEQYQARDLEFAAISLDDLKDINTLVPKFLMQMNAKMPAYLLNVSDPELAINAVDPQWSGALPATFLYSAKGEVVYKHFGRVDPVELRAEIEKVVGSKQ